MWYGFFDTARKVHMLLAFEPHSKAELFKESFQDYCCFETLLDGHCYSIYVLLF